MGKKAAFSEASLEFRPLLAGEEEEASRLLTRAPRVEPLRISKFDHDLQPRVSVLFSLLMMGFFGLLLIFSVEPEDREKAGTLMLPALLLFSLVMPFGMYALARLTSWAPKHLHVDAETGRIELNGVHVASLDQVGVPRLIADYELDWGNALVGRVERVPAVLLPRDDAQPLVLFDHPTSIRMRARLPQIADHLNALIAEYNYRKKVRQWLDERTSTNTPYRRPEASS